MSTHDVIVVGARAAGAATALLLARLGHDVLVVDRAELPSDTISTHQLARTAVVALQRWGLLDDVIASGAPAIRQVVFHSDQARTTHDIKQKSGVDCLVAPRRWALDTLLSDAARRAGATVRYGVTVTGVSRDGSGRVVGVASHDRRGEPVELRAQFLVGADGLGSRIARAVNSPRIADRGAPGAAIYAYYTGLPRPAIEFVTRTGTFAGVFPTHHDEAAIWVCLPTSAALAARKGRSAEVAFAAVLERAAPELAGRLRAAVRTSPVRGMLRAPNQIRRGVGSGWALVGDAAYHRDPVTGHGISDAYRDAELLAVALDRVLTGVAEEPEALAGYENARLGAIGEIFDLTCALATYPPLSSFIELNKRLGAAIDAEAAALAARPIPGSALARV
ncbi:MAG TPA: NAD(P)/FAD-dependent oxidoreductase [Micromonosporaceae bacterium]|jgi:2-polyprenyl-6-methoxyphenol hydroxylase-like FAD-dependent oxidoreductase